MKNNKDFDFISSKLEDENITAPDSLNEESIKAKLEKGTNVDKIVKFKPNNKRFVKGAVSIAAAIALIVVSVSAVNHFGNREYEPKDNAEPTVTTYKDSGDLVYFKDYEEIDTFMKERLDEREQEHGVLIKDYAVKSGDAIAESASPEMSYSANGAAAEQSSYSETYKQVDAVDEADIVKTDGKYIYYVDESESEIIISSATNGETKKVSSIKYNDRDNVSEIFIKDNYLVSISHGYKSINKEDWKTITNVRTYDISDKNKPKLEYKYSQSGYYDSSRMIGDCVYVVSGEMNFYYIKNHTIPCATNEKGEFKELSVDNIYAIKDTKQGNYTIIGALDIKNGAKAKKTKAVIGSVDEVYCNENNMYITGINYDYGAYNYKSECTIVKIALDKTNINIAATGRIKGNVNSQYSMDEKDGYFRIATTKQTKKGKDINVLYVLDEKLDVVGKVNGFAKNEHIEAVRYIGDMAYVITYEQTDPLFIIDLKDPKNPTILGEVKISGFSTMLVPIDEKTILGIGYSTDETEFGEATNGLKLALFDVSNATKPKVIDEKELEGVDSDVQEEPKAFVVNKEKDYFALPANFNDYEDAGALVFSVKHGKIKILNKFIGDNLTEADRCVFIDDYIYVVDTFEQIIDSFEV